MAHSYMHTKSEIEEEIHLCKACANRQENKTAMQVVNDDSCELCKGIFGRLGGIAERIATKLETMDAEYKTFLIGTRIPKEMAAKEEYIWERKGLGKESLKTELNREIGKLIENRYKKYRYDPNPDIKVIYDIGAGLIDVELSQLFFSGKYKKLKRGIRQTKKFGSDEESVEEFITPTILAAARGEKAIFHGHGREDIDVLMLGEGRPFVVEIIGPRVRTISLSEISSEINKKAKGKVEVAHLKYTSGGTIKEIKRARFDKTYKAIVELEKKIKKDDLGKILEKCLLLQKTPTRVLNRRADIVRKRKVKEIKPKFLDSKHFELILTTEAGTYVKEFIHGDEGRTEPSISSMLGVSAKCKELNVLRIYSEWYEDFW